MTRYGAYSRERYYEDKRRLRQHSTSTRLLAQVLDMCGNSFCEPLFAFLDGVDLQRLARVTPFLAFELESYKPHLADVLVSSLPATNAEARALVTTSTAFHVSALMSGRVRCTTCPFVNTRAITFEPLFASRALAFQLEETGETRTCDACGAETGEEAYALDLLDKTLAHDIMSSADKSIRMASACRAVLVHFDETDTVMQGPQLVEHFLPGTTFEEYLTRPESIFMFVPKKNDNNELTLTNELTLKPHVQL